MELEDICAKHPQLVHFARRFSLEPRGQDAEDVVQEAYLRMLRLSRAGEKNWTWVFEVVKNAGLEMRQSRHRLKRGGGAVALSMDEAIPSASQPSHENLVVVRIMISLASSQLTHRMRREMQALLDGVPATSSGCRMRRLRLRAKLRQIWKVN